MVKGLEILIEIEEKNWEKRREEFRRKEPYGREIKYLY